VNPLSTPTDFQARAIARLQQALPKATITVTGALKLHFVFPDGRISDADLQRTYERCAEAPTRCETILDDYVRMVSETNAKKPATRDDVVVQLRSQADLDRMDAAAESMVQQLKLSGDERARTLANNRVFRRRLGGDLWEIAVVNQPASLIPVTPLVARDAGIKDEADLWPTAVANLARHYSKLDGVPFPNLPFIKTLYLDDWGAALLTHPDAWAAIAKTTHGDLLAVAPSRSGVLFCGSKDDRDALGMLQIAGQAIAKKDPDRLSTTVLRWTASGWVAAQP
jgi:hypothetical protein